VRFFAMVSPKNFLLMSARRGQNYPILESSSTFLQLSIQTVVNPCDPDIVKVGDAG
jgi:hypothetical protein